MTMLSDRYITITEAALLLSVNRVTIRRWVKQGRLRAERIGKIKLTLRADILAIARERGIDLSAWRMVYLDF